MKTTRKILMTMLAVLLLVFVAACGGESEEPETDPKAGVTNEDDSDQDESEDIDHDEESDEGDRSDEVSSDEEYEESSVTNNINDTDKVTESNKEDYLKKLNDMEEADRNLESATTTEGLEDQEAERYKKWDEALNDIYDVLEEELSAEDMDELKEDQRNWIKERDEIAKEASLKYEGGTTESLEYLATQASLTKERSYELVANYMK